jgi:hypothetical protein
MNMAIFTAKSKCFFAIIAQSGDNRLTFSREFCRLFTDFNKGPLNLL